MIRRTIFPWIAGFAAVFVFFLANPFAGCAASPETSSQPLEVTISQGIARLGYLWPLFVPGRITSRYALRTHTVTGEADYHMGVDISVPHGASIRAARAGTVLFSGLRGGYGNAVIIKHDEKNSSLYGHCDRLFVKRNQKVHQGQMIALVGNTGRTTGPHLHFEIRTGRGAVNPLEFWKQHGETAGP
ncbi:MAG: M23 family metallopeptidase [Synergistaceae bacterium]|nr:M23 family metallopeptidase [Synergistaceae bacterium]